MGIGLAFILSIGITESVLSLSEITEDSGKVYWTFFASASKPEEAYSFYYNPQDYTTKDGLNVEPQDNLELVIYPEHPKCTYQLNKQVKKSGILNTMTYYTLSNPEKVAMVTISDGKSGNKQLDGTVVSSLQIKDTDGDGKVTIETQGLLSGKFSCPSQSNVVLVYDEDISKYNFFYKNELDNYISSVSYTGGNIVGYLAGLYLSKNNLKINRDFTSTADNVEFSGTDEVILEIDFGYPTFTITADQDYFDSTTYRTNVAKPEISDIDYNNEVKVDDTTTIQLKLKNLEKSEALASIEASSKYGSISPSSKSVSIKEDASYVYFQYKAPNYNICSDIDFKICGTSQFSSVECDSEKIKICSRDERNVREYCGDNICQSYESFSTCPDDCNKGGGGGGSIECAWYQTPSTKTEYGFLYWRAYTPFIEPKEKEVCKVSNIFNILAILIVFSILSAYAIYLNKPRRK